MDPRHICDSYHEAPGGVTQASLETATNRSLHLLVLGCNTWHHWQPRLLLLLFCLQCGPLTYSVQPHSQLKRSARMLQCILFSSSLCSQKRIPTDLDIVQVNTNTSSFPTLAFSNIFYLALLFLLLSSFLSSFSAQIVIGGWWPSWAGICFRFLPTGEFSHHCRILLVLGA